ncbi:related to pisatin demethylase (cytochrome P450) [Phialocephala subalpina]|uniref:Related to pisatin demethylase (Cytochrome P450) n=1 Tax=Phialocephala subalpina TaxID=576137 RepID=A0A1L7WPG4_9HELO|nr:related to pisatin demethylase (cytochrome P450) [Phialocephala subalpina]
MSGILNNAVVGWKTLLLSTLSLLAILAVAQIFSAWYRLRHIKGPWSAGFSKLWLLRHVGGPTMHTDLAEVCSKYGSLARIGPNDLVTSNPEVLRRILGVRSAYVRSDFYDGMRTEPGIDSVLSQRDDEKHNTLRTKMAAGYSGKENDNLEDTIDRSVLALVNLIDKKYISSKEIFRPFDFGRKAQYFTLDVISDVAFGECFGDLESDGDMYEYIKTIETFMPALMIFSVYPWLNKILESSFMKRFLPSDKDLTGVGKLKGIAKRVVGERFGPDAKDHRDMLGSFIRHGLTQDEAISSTVVQIIAGSDSTATAIRSTLLHIITNPSITSKLLDEISRTFPSSPISNIEALSLPYLQATIKEGLRICPPATALLSKEVPIGGDTINNLFVPAGTKIGWCPWAIFRNKEIWGEDADYFRPERWLEGDEGKRREMEGGLDLVFSGGKWQCLGKNVALIELNKVFVELLRNFEISVVDPTKAPWKSINKGFFLQSEMWLRAERREPRL